MQGGLLLDVVVGKSTTVFKLLASKDQSLLVRRNALLILDLRLNIVDSIRGLNLEGDGLAREGLDEAGVSLVLHKIWLQMANVESTESR